MFLKLKNKKKTVVVNAVVCPCKQCNGIRHTLQGFCLQKVFSKPVTIQKATVK